MIMTKPYSLRLDEQTHDEAQDIFANLGMDFSTGVKVYLKKVIRTNGIPFKVSNEPTGLDRSLNELKDGNYKSFNSVDELFDDLDN